MDAKSVVIETIGALPVGTVVAWAAVIIAIIIAIVAGITKLYKVFEKTHKLKEENESVKEMVNRHDAFFQKIDKQLDDIQGVLLKVEEHDEKLSNVGTQLNEIKTILDKQDETDLKKMRHSIVKAGEEAILKGSMTIREWKSLHELYDTYHDEKNGNGYVTSLIQKVDNNVEVVGKLNEQGEDIE